MPPQENKSPQADPFSQVVDRLKQANNVLVTVSSSPSVDQLSACIALTLALNKQGKHATAVFSGQVPSTIGFLEPDKTLEKNTDSLRDFIISLDKSKADKLRYKVEDDVVKIFITPYKTSISEKDLDFSQGDFNIDAVVALGVHERTELDEVIVAHGRILHDATVISVNTAAGAELGSINWLDGGASSLSEMTCDLIVALGKELLDTQTATALLTGVVSETDRFRNEKSSPHTMSVSGILMAAGASTQLIASKLEEPEAPSDEIPEVVEGDENPEAPHSDGTIEIDHEADDQIHIDDAGNLQQIEELLKQQEEMEDNQTGSEPETPSPEEQPADRQEGDETPGDAPESSALPSSMILTPPSIGGQITANSEPEQYSGSSDPLSNPFATATGPTLTHGDQGEQQKTLSQIEESVNSPHLEQPEPGAETEKESPSADIPPPPEPDYARDAVQRAVEAANDYKPEPIESLGAVNVDLPLADGDVPPPPAGLLPDEPATEEQAVSPPPPVPPPMPPIV